MDSYKSEQKRIANTKRKDYRQQFKNDKADARLLLDEFKEGIFAKHSAKFGVKELKLILDQWAKWEPNKLIKFIEKFKAEQ